MENFPKVASWEEGGKEEKVKMAPVLLGLERITLDRPSISRVSICAGRFGESVVFLRHFQVSSNLKGAMETLFLSICVCNLETLQFILIGTVVIG